MHALSKAQAGCFCVHRPKRVCQSVLPTSVSVCEVCLLHRFIVTPNVVEDVVAAVQFAADYGLKVQARGTGHQLAGLALAACGVTIDMKNFMESSLDEATGLATVQASPAMIRLLGALFTPEGPLTRSSSCPFCMQIPQSSSVHDWTLSYFLPKLEYCP